MTHLPTKFFFLFFLANLFFPFVLTGCAAPDKHVTEMQYHQLDSDLDDCLIEYYHEKLHPDLARVEAICLLMITKREAFSD